MPSGVCWDLIYDTDQAHLRVTSVQQGLPRRADDRIFSDGTPVLYEIRCFTSVDK